ncbi:MAG: hypothetical protein ACK4YV_06845 [Emticicia sp.]
MKKRFENIDDLTRFKINTLHDEDVEMNENLIWVKIEEELNRKTKIRVLAWRRIAAAACLILLLGGSIFLINKNRINEVSNIKSPQSTVAKVLLLTKNDFNKKTKTIDNKHITINKRIKKVIKEERLKLDVGQIEKPKVITIETSVIAFKQIKLPQILPEVLPKMATTKMRVMHISEYQAQTSEVFIKPKVFYVQTDIQNIIKNQTPIIPYSLANISN